MSPMRSLMANRRAPEASGEEGDVTKPREVPGQFRKTKLCRFFELGCCRYEEGCAFAHTRRELEDLPDLKKTSICKSWQLGCCDLSAEECTYAHGKEDLRRTPFGQRRTRHGKKASSYKEYRDGCDDSTSGGDGHSPFMYMDRTGSMSSQSSDSFATQEETNVASALLWDPLGSSAESDFGLSELSLGWGQTVLKEQGPYLKKSTKYRQEAAANEEDMGFFQSCPLPVLLDVLSQQQKSHDASWSAETVPPYAASVVLAPMQVSTSNKIHIEQMLKQAMPEHYED